MITLLALFSTLGLAGWMYLAFFNGNFWQILLPGSPPAPDPWPDIDIIIPARNEADVLPNSLPSLLVQDYPGAWRIILIDDQSTDGTAPTARAIATQKDVSHRLMIVTAPEKQPGWSGKVGAMQEGVTHSSAAYILFTDADIWHPPDSLRKLASRAVEQKLDLVSRMVRLNCVSRAEKLLIPAFVFFFAMLYPFRRANDPQSSVCAAAGGVMLVKREALDRAGGLSEIKSELIDDCALAQLIKLHSDRDSKGIELTLSNDIRSLREYPEIRDIWQMIARTAFTQLHYSNLLLAGTVFGMALLFLAPFLTPLMGGSFALATGLTLWLVMALLYMPTVQFYRLHYIWSLTLPLAALIYIGATVDSARLYWQGKGGQWKGRNTASPN